MVKRLWLALLLCLCLVGAAALPALAADDGHEREEYESLHQLPSVGEIGTGSEISQQFRPTEYEEPGFFRFIYYPLFGVGLLMILGVMFLYLLWQPVFSREARAKRRR